MDISSWAEMEINMIMNMNDLHYVDHFQTMMGPVDEMPFNNNCTYGIQSSQVAGLLEEKPAFFGSKKETHQNSSFSFSNSPVTTSAVQKLFENSNTSVKTEALPSGATINFSSSAISMDSYFEAIGFGVGDFSHEKKSNSRTPLQAQDHVLAERKRRERLTQSFITLSALIPNLRKLDKASILGDAIKYIKQLEEQVKTLEEQAKKCDDEPVAAVKRARILSSYEDSSSFDENCSKSTEKSVPEIEVRVSDGNILIRMYCKKQAKILKEIFSKVEMFHLTIISSSVIPFGYITTHITIIAKMDHQSSMKPENVVHKIREAILKLI